MCLQLDAKTLVRAVVRQAVVRQAVWGTPIGVFALRMFESPAAGPHLCQRHLRSKSAGQLAHPLELSCTPRLLEDGLLELQLPPQAIPTDRPCLPLVHDCLHGSVRWEEDQHAMGHSASNPDDCSPKVSLVATVSAVLEAAIEGDSARARAEY
jgi:hypothetical protein